MAKIRYLQRTHDSKTGDEKTVDEQCARVLVLLGKAEYLTLQSNAGRGRKKVNAGNG